MSPSIEIPLSESQQMYLVTIARLRNGDAPLPLSQLAEALSISPVSANEMCRKLQDEGLVVYRPYKGALLTEEGQEQAYYTLRRHRLWEVFLVEKLGFDYDQAHQAACQLEHTTPDSVADALDAFLGHPGANPEGEPIPNGDGVLPQRQLYPLSSLSIGQRAHIVRCDVDGDTCRYLEEQGVHPGASLVVLAKAEKSLLLQIGERRVSLSRSLAEAIRVERDVEAIEAGRDLSTRAKGERDTMRSAVSTSVNQIPLNELKVGQKGVVVHIGGKGPARRRMMDMGVVPGSEIKAVRVAPLGDPIEFEVKGYSLSLRKSEAKMITIEVSEEAQEKAR